MLCHTIPPRVIFLLSYSTPQGHCLGHEHNVRTDKQTPNHRQLIYVKRTERSVEECCVHESVITGGLQVPSQCLCQQWHMLLHSSAPISVHHLDCCCPCVISCLPWAVDQPPTKRAVQVRACASGKLSISHNDDFPYIYNMADHISHVALTIYPSVILNVLYQ